MCTAKFKYINLMWKHINEEGHHISNENFYKEPEKPTDAPLGETPDESKKRIAKEMTKVAEESTSIENFFGVQTKPPANFGRFWNPCTEKKVE